MVQSFGESLSWVPKSRHLGESLSRAHDYARGQNHGAVSLEHMLLALLEDPDAAAVLQVCGVNTEVVAAEIGGRLRELEEVSSDDPVVSVGLSKILEYAVAAARQSKRQDVNGAIVLAAIVGEGKSVAAEILRAHGLTFEEAIKALQSDSLRSRLQDAAPGGGEAGGGGGISGGGTVGQVGSVSRQPAMEGGEPRPADGIARSGGQTTEEILETARQRVGRKAHGHEPYSPVPEGHGGGQAGRGGADDGSGLPSRSGGTQWPPVAPEPSQVPGQIAGQSPTTAEGGPVARSTAPAGPPPLPPAQPMSPKRPMPGPALGGDHVDGGRAPAGLGPGPQVRHRPAAVNAADEAMVPGSAQEPVSVDAGSLVENIPRRMRVGVAEMVEVRIARAGVVGVDAGLQGRGGPHQHDVVVTKAMSVRLRAPEGGFFVESASPETQWIDNAFGMYSDNFASWRFVVTPKVSGERRLQLIVAARTVGADGLMAETALPDQIVSVRVRMNYSRVGMKWFGWALAAVIGGLLARFGEGLWAIAFPVFKAFVGPV